MMSWSSYLHNRISYNDETMNLIKRGQGNHSNVTYLDEMA